MTFIIRGNLFSPHLGEAIPIEHKRMEQLARRKWHQHPATPPPGLLLEPSLIVKRIVGKLDRSGHGVDCHRDPELITRIHAQSEPRKTGSDGGSKPGGERPGYSRITLAEGSGVLGEQIETETSEESVKDAVNQKDEGERGGKAKVRR